MKGIIIFKALFQLSLTSWWHCVSKKRGRFDRRRHPTVKVSLIRCQARVYYNCNRHLQSLVQMCQICCCRCRLNWQPINDRCCCCRHKRRRLKFNCEPNLRIYRMQMHVKGCVKQPLHNNCSRYQPPAKECAVNFYCIFFYTLLAAWHPQRRRWLFNSAFEFLVSKCDL